MKKWIVILLLVLQIPMLTSAQNNALRRKVHLAALQAMDEYESMFNLKSDKYDKFIGQFVSENALVYNDLLGKSFEQNMTAKQYADLLVNSKEFFDVHIYNIKRGDLLRTPDGWELPVEFQKDVIYTDSKGVLFSSPEFYGASYDIKINYLYDSEQDRCYIRSIEGGVKSDNRLPKDYDVIVRVNKFNKNKMLKNSSRVYNLVTYGDGKKLDFNSVNQAFVPGNLSTRGFRADLQTWEADTYIRKKLDKTTGMYSLKANRKMGRIKLRYGMTAGNAFHVDNEHDYSNVSSKSSEYGVDLGLVFGSITRTRFGIFVGAAMNEGSIMFVNNSVVVAATSYETYTEVERLENQKQQFNFSDLSAQCYFNFEHSIINRLAINWTVGAKSYLNFDSGLGVYTVDQVGADVWVEDDGTTYETINTRQPLSFDSFSNYAGKLSRALLPISVVGTLGVNVFITRSIMVNIKAGYEYGFSEYVDFSNQGEFNNLQSTDVGIGATAPFVSSFSASRRGIWVEGGLTFKFF